MKILLTGSAGFIGTHVLQLLNTGEHTITCWDCLDPQVHPGEQRRWPRAGEMPMPEEPFDVVIHLAAKVGVGQSMYEPASYVECNELDTARLLEGLAKVKPGRLVVASSMSVYGEGRYYDDCYGDLVDDATRGTITDDFDPRPTPECKPPSLRSIYALTKYSQEQLSLIWGEAHGVPTVALRFFNTYGPGQALTNPYTGVLAIFATQLLNGKAPTIYEDGQQTRDFVYVEDVARAVVHAALGYEVAETAPAPDSDGFQRVDVPPGTYNVGTGVPTTVERVALLLAEKLGADIPPVILGTKRAGDIRHCYADVTKLRATGWEPRVSFEEGITRYAEWLRGQEVPVDRSEVAARELERAGLVR